MNQHLTFLLALLRGEPPPAGLAEADWQAVAQAAARHGVAPLLYWELEGKRERGNREAELGGSSGADIPLGTRSTASPIPTPLHQPSTLNPQPPPPSDSPVSHSPDLFPLAPSVPLCGQPAIPSLAVPTTVEPRVPPVSPSASPSAAVSESAGVPPSILAALREAFLQNTLRNTLLYRDLALVLTTLQAAGIKVAVLKGAHLAALVYPHIGCRRMVDIDLLVPKHDLELAQGRLQTLGFSAASTAAASDYVHISQHLARMFKSFSPSIELHWTLFAPAFPFIIRPEELLARGQRAGIAGVTTLVLAPEDSILHQCIHLAVHKYSHHGLRPLCDLAATLAHHRAELDWAAMLVRAREWRALPCLHLGLRLAAGLLQAEVPPGFLAETRPRQFDEAYYETARASVLEAGEGVPDEELTPEIRRHGRLADGLAANSPSGRLRAVWRLLFPGRQHMAIYLRQYHGLALTGHRRWSCYLVRFMDLVPRGLRYCRHALRHREAATRRAAQLRREAQLWRYLTSR